MTSSSASARETALYPDGTIVTAAGTGEAGFVSDGGPSVGTKLYYPYGVGIDDAGNLYIADHYNHRIRKVTPSGTITTVAGSGTAGFISDGGPAVGTSLHYPTGVTADASGNLFIADRHNHRIRKVSPGGTIVTVAGNGQAGFLSDGGPAVATKLHYPWSTAVDQAGNLYIADQHNHRIRKVSPSGIITTIAGNGQAGFVSDGGPAVATKLYYPTEVAVDGEGNVFIADQHNHRVRKVSPGGIITTVAGNGQSGYVTDGGPAVATKLNYPTGVTVDSAGNLYIGELHNHRVRKVTPDGIITTVAGDGTAGYVADGGPGVGTRLYHSTGVVVDASGSLFIADTYNHRIRRVYGVAGVKPQVPPVADLFGEIVAPASVVRDQEFDLGARVRSRGPAIVGGQDVTVVLTLADGLVAASGSTGRRLSRTFAGAELLPYAGALDGVFRVRAPQGTLPGTYESTLEIQYSGDLNLKDNTFTLPVTVVVPAPVADEIALTIYQETVPEVAPGRDARFNLRFLAPAGQPVNPGVLVQRYTAPTGFVFTGRPVYGYHDTVYGLISGDLDHEFQDGGRTLIVRANPHLNTTATDTGTLIYTLGLQAQQGAAPGVRNDGSASIGRRTPVQIQAKVTGSAVGGQSVRITQSQQDKARVRPGQEWVYPAVFTVTNTGVGRIGTHPVVLTAPQGLRFMEDSTAVSRQDDGGRETVASGERSNGNRTLTLREVKLDLDPGKWAALYPAIEVDDSAAPATVKVAIEVGSPAIATGHATVTIEP